MKMSNIRLIIIWILLILPFFSIASQDVVKEWKRTYQVTSDARLEINNKFGDIEVQTWPNNEVKVEVTISAEGGDRERIQKLVDEIEIRESASQDHVEIRTILQNENKIQKVEISIDYVVHMPQTLHFRVENSFGNLAVPNLSGILEASVNYGAFKGGSLSNPGSELRLRFSKGEVDDFAGYLIMLEYGGLSMDRAGKTRVESSFSTIEIDAVEELTLESSYDQVEIDRAGKLSIRGEFSNFEIDRLEKSIEAEVEYGGMEIDNVASNFELIKIRSEFGGVEINIPDDASYLFYTRAEFGSISLPKSADILDHQKDIAFKEYTGRVGDNPGTRKVEIEVEYASISID